MGGYDLLNFLMLFFLFFGRLTYTIEEFGVSIPLFSFSSLLVHCTSKVIRKPLYDIVFVEYMKCFSVPHVVEMLYPVGFRLPPVHAIFYFEILLQNTDWFFVGRRILLHFEAVDSAFCAWINGNPVGYRYISLSL